MAHPIDSLPRLLATDIWLQPTILNQCSFEIDLDSSDIMLYDRSNGLTAQVYGDNTAPFKYGRRRRVVVQQKLNTIIRMGG